MNALKKSMERFYVEALAKSLEKNWVLEENESPDFIVIEGSKKFGLEVTQVFMGPQGQSGSTIKRIESATEKRINTLRLQYESITKEPIIVKLFGNLGEENLKNLVPSIVSADLSSNTNGPKD